VGSAKYEPSGGNETRWARKRKLKQHGKFAGNETPKQMFAVTVHFLSGDNFLMDQTGTAVPDWRLF
jgi:hypothetical protein